MSKFEWSTEAITSLAGQGDLYLRLKKDFRSTMVDENDLLEEEVLEPVHISRTSSSLSLQYGLSTFSSSGTSRLTPPGTSHLTPPGTSHHTPSGSTTASHSLPGPSHESSSHYARGLACPLPCSDEVDLTNLSPENTQISSSEEDLPAVTFSSDDSALITKDGLYDMFIPANSREGVYLILDLCVDDARKAFKVLVNGPSVCGIIQLKRNKCFRGRSKKITIDDEDELFEEAILYYKHPSFNPNIPIRISFKNQPGLDTGGVTRQFFTDLPHKFARKDVFQLFVGPPERLRPAYSPQVLPLMKILGIVIAHSLLHEGPSFPFLHLLCTGI